MLGSTAFSRKLRNYHLVFTHYDDINLLIAEIYPYGVGALLTYRLLDSTEAHWTEDFNSLFLAFRSCRREFPWTFNTYQLNGSLW